MIAIIPARGGSLRLPGKNTKLLEGKPLIVYTIEAALASQYINKVIVSTDDEDIAAVAREAGAEVPGLRPSFLATATASSNDVIAYTLKLVQEKYQEDVKECVLLQPTSPLRTAKHIDAAIALFFSKEAAAVISCTKEHHPLHWHTYMNAFGVLETIDFSTQRTSFFPNGAIYVLAATVINSGVYYTAETYGYVMDRKESVDIDTQEDWDYVEFLLQKNVGEEECF